MTQETQKAVITPSKAPSAEGCDFATYIDQGVGTVNEVTEMARDVMAITVPGQAAASLTAQTTEHLATTIAQLSYPGTKQEKLISTLEANTQKTLTGALAGAYIAQNCVECPVADNCNLLQALRDQYDDGLSAKAQNETVALVLQAQKLAETIKPSFTSLIATQERIENGSKPQYKLGDIMRANDSSRGGISRMLMHPANKPYRNETITALRQLLKQNSKGGALAKKADEQGAFNVFDGMAVEAFVAEATVNSELITEVGPATRAQDVTEGTDFFFHFADETGTDRAVRVDAKSSGKFRKLKAAGSVEPLKVGADTGHFGVKTVRTKDTAGRTHKEHVLVICPTGAFGDIDSGFDATRLPETGCVDLQQTPNLEFTRLIDQALIAFTEHYQ